MARTLVFDDVISQSLKSPVGEAFEFLKSAGTVAAPGTTSEKEFIIIVRLAVMVELEIAKFTVPFW